MRTFAPAGRSADVQVMLRAAPAGQLWPPFGLVSVTVGLRFTRQLATVTRVLLRLSALLAALGWASLTPVGLPP